MATRYTNSVPQGREGTGAATILGPSRALQYVLSQQQGNQNRLMMEQQRFQQQQSQYNSQFNKSLMELNELSNTPLFANDFAEVTNDLMRQGGQLMSQGINPYNPYQNESSREAVRQWQGEVNKLRSAKTAVENLYKERQAQVKQYLTNPDQYDFDDFQKLRDFEKNVSLEDILEGSATLPQLQQRLNISEDITKQYGQLYTDRTEMTTDASGNPIRREIREPDVNRIRNIVNTEFTSGSKYGQEVNRRLRREFGEQATIDNLLGTTNRDEIRQILDAEFRNPTDNNPIVELRANGINARPGSPEYETFLEQAVNEQLKAEQILDTAKQDAANALIGRTNTRVNQRFDFSVRDQQLQEQSAARAARNSNAAYQNSLLNIQVKQARLNGEDPTAMALAEEAVDVDFSEDYGDGDTEAGIKVFSTIPLNTSSISISPSTTTDVKSGSKVKQNEIRGNITGVGIVAYDSNGNVVKGNSPEELARNPNVVRFAPQVLVQDNKRRSYSYNPNNIPVTSLSKAAQANVKKSINMQTQTAQELNNQLKKRPQTTNQSSTSWQNYNSGVNSLFGTGASQNTTTNRRGSYDNL